MNQEQVVREIRKFRELLWLRHGCSVADLYGDDGEMSCNKCMIDFKRASAESIEEMFYKHGVAQLTKAAPILNVDANGSPTFD